jgi:cytochrome c oxidase subunit I
VQHWLGNEGMPRRYADYLPIDGFTALNAISSIFAFVLGASTLPFIWNVYKSASSPKVAIDDPWGWGRSLEWATSSPPPRHNFVSIPRIRSESPAFDLHHPEIAALELVEGNELGDERDAADAPAVSGRQAHLEEQMGHPIDEEKGETDR